MPPSWQQINHSLNTLLPSPRHSLLLATAVLRSAIFRVPQGSPLHHSARALLQWGPGSCSSPPKTCAQWILERSGLICVMNTWLMVHIWLGQPCDEVIIAPNLVVVHRIGALVAMLMATKVQVHLWSLWKFNENHNNTISTKPLHTIDYTYQQ